MLSLESIKAQLRFIGAGKFILARGEIRELPGILWDDEQILKVAYGIHEGGTGLLLATDKRLLFVDKRFFHLRCDEIPYDFIMGAKFKLGMFTGTLIIPSRVSDLELKGIPKRQAREFAEFIDEKICHHGEVPAESAAPTTDQRSYYPHPPA